MIAPRARPFVLSFEPAALERCFLVADVLRERYNDPSSEYGLIGLARQSNPFHVFRTMLLPGQQTSSAHVKQPGRHVAKMAREIERVADETGEALYAPVFIHRHPGGVGRSAIDETFLNEVFIQQVSTAFCFRELRVIRPADLACNCVIDLSEHAAHLNDATGGWVLRVEFSVAFSLIINARREHSIDAVESWYCPSCGESQIRAVPASVVLPTPWPLPRQALRPMKRQIEREIDKEIVDTVRF